VTTPTDGLAGAGRPLDGMLVVALEQAVAAPFATRQLADLGARVIKIERPGRGDFARDYDSAAGEGMSSWFVWLNRAKESVVLDLKADDGRRALDSLISRADVFVCNLAPAAIRRLGLEAAGLTARHPRLVACQLSGYGETGPYADRKAYDLLIQAEAGILAVTGSPDAPAKAGISIADIAGGMYAYSGILSALLQRTTTGRGGVVAVSLFAALAEWMSHPLQLARLTGQPPSRQGARHATIVPYGDYVTAGGDEVLLAVQNEAEWTRLCRDVLDLPGMAGDSRFAGNQQRVEHRGEVERRLGPAVARLATSELVRLLERAQIAYASVKEVGQVLSHPQLAPRWQAITAGDRLVEVLPPPVQHSDFGPAMGPVPRHGQHTEAVLAEIAGGPGPAMAPQATLATVDPFPVAVLAALFDDGLGTAGHGEQLPAYWHLAACAAAPPSGVLAADGHPGDGPVPAPAHLPRRMLAGGRLRLHSPVRVGERLTRRTLVTASTDKAGRSGPLRFVTVETQLSRPGGELVLVEEQDIVYRAAGQAAPGPGVPGAPGAAGPPLTRHGPLHAVFRADAVALQRFSAATSNPHRIHYDYPYVTSVEGYPGLVVHGPLLLLSLLELIRLDLPGRAVAAVSFQARSPVFAGQAVDLAGAADGRDRVRLAARHDDGSMAMTCEVNLCPAGRLPPG
jgi:itaconate CoA-transferase